MKAIWCIEVLLTCFIFGGCIAIQNLSVIQNKCEECSFEVDEAIDEIVEILKREEPRVFTWQKPCEKCLFNGGVTVKRSGQSCSRQTTRTIRRQSLELIFSNLTVNCECNLPRNPEEMVKQIQTAINASTSPCSGTSGIKLSYGLAEYNPNIDIQECASKRDLIKLGKTSLAKTTVTWENVRVDMQLKTKGNIPPKITKFRIVSNDYQNMVTECQTDDVGKSSCQCLVRSQLLVKAALREAQQWIYCIVNGKYPDVARIINKLHCMH